MDPQTFWSMIEASTTPHGLHSRLLQLDNDELVAFERLHEDHVRRAYSWDLWGAAYLINGGCSDDTFEYFRAALIARGRATYERALQDPDSLAEVDFGPDEEWEDWMSPTMHVVRARAGKYGFAGSPTGPAPTTPSGTKWDEDELPRRFPRLAAKHG